jgi:tetratricopeptide (TPR) repeat protein
LTDLGGTEHDVHAARSALTRACELDPFVPWNWLELARLNRVIGNDSAAIGLTEHALELEPNTTRGWLFLCRLEFEAGRIDRAEAAFDRAENTLRLADRAGISSYDAELVRGDPAEISRLRRDLDRR